MLKLSRAITAICTAAAMLFAGVCPLCRAEEESKISAENIVSESVINYFTWNRLLDKGEVHGIDAAENEFMTLNQTVYADVKWIEKYLDASYVWDGKTKSVAFGDGENTGNVKCGDFDAEDTSGENGFFLEEYTYIPLKGLSESMGWHFYSGDAFWILSKTLEIEDAVTADMTKEIIEAGKTKLFDYNFETEKPKLELGLWDGATANTFVMPCEIVTEDGNSFMQLGSSSLKYGGLYLPPIENTRDTKIELEFDAAKSEDFNGSSFIVLIQCFKNGVFKSYVDGIYQTPKDPGKWTHIKKELDTSKVPADATDIRIVFCTSNQPSQGEASGRIMVDNIKVRSYPYYTDTSVSPKIKADKVGNWYILGETVKMTPTNKIDEEKYKAVTAEVYDSENKLVHTGTVTSAEFNSGYSWTPEKQGYYEFQFYTIDKYGIKDTLYEFYTKKNPKTQETVKLYIERQGIVVARYKTKPMEERCDRLAVSIDPGTYLNPEIVNGRKNGLRGDQVELADLLGFRKIRYHFLSPDGLAYKTPSKANIHRGEFDFAEWDGSVNEALKYGFDLVLNIMGTPRYASPYRTGYTSPTGGGINYYAPVNIEAWRAYVEYAVKRYKDVCNIWEVWNEPHVYGGSVFWKGITKDFAEIQKSAYNVIKKYQPGDESLVTLGGIGARRYTNFYEELVQTDAYDCYDAIAMHGWDIDPWNYNKIAEDYGKEPKPFCSTEMHMMLRASDSEYLNNTEKEEAMRMVVEFLKDFKYGALFTTFFAVNVSDDKDWLQYLNKNKIYGQGIEGGAFRVGLYSPRFVAIAMNTFFDTIGKEYDYVDEYLLANKKQNAVRVKSDSKDQLIVWNVGGSKSNPTELSTLITDCANEDFKIVDWENNDVDTSDLKNIIIKPETMYFISGLDSEKLDKIPSAQGDELYTGQVLYNITEKAKTDTSNILTHVVTNGDTKPLFNKDTFELNNDISYTDTNWRYIAKEPNTSQEDFSAKFALSVTDDGMYLVAKVNDTNDNAIADSPEEISQKSGLQFAFDTVGDRSGNGYQECYVGLNYAGKPIVYKKTAPYIGGDMISDFTESGNIIENAAVQRITDGSEITYMVYLPSKEIYPYEKNVNDAIHFSIIANRNDGTKNIGYLEWGGGLADEKDPKKFGNVWLDKTVAEENGVYYPYMAVANNKPLFDKNTLEYADNISWISDNMKYVSLIAGDNTADETFKAKFAVGVTEEGIYLAAEVDDNDVNMDADSVGGMWSKDSMQFAFDTGMRGNTDELIGFHFGRAAGKGDTLFKEDAPFITAEKAPAGYTQKKTVVTEGIHNVTVSDGKIIYKAFIPAAEIYPFNIAENETLKMSVLFNQNREGKRVGYLEWNSGIGASKNPKEYGIISYK